MGRLTERDAEYYFANREAHGFNTLGWINVKCAGNDYPVPRQNSNTLRIMRLERVNRGGLRR